MKKIKFKFEPIDSEIFDVIYRPYAVVHLKTKDGSHWHKSRMIIDTGADYTLLPRFYAETLGINLTEDCFVQTTYGVGGPENVYIYKGLKVRLGDFERTIPVGFLDRDDIPPLLGRHEFFETFKSVFDKKEVIFQESK